MVQEVALLRADFWVGQRLFKRFGLHPFAVLPIESLLGDFADVDFRVEVGGEGLVVVAGVAVDNVEVLNLVKVMLGGISRVDARYARIETATEDGCQASLFKAVFEGPLPRIFKVCLVFRLVVGRVEV